MDAKLNSAEKECTNCRMFESCLDAGFVDADRHDNICSKWQEDELSECQRRIDKLTQTVLDLELKLEAEKKHSAQLVAKIEKTRGCERKLRIATRALENISHGGINPQMWADKTLKEMEEV